MPVLSIAEWFVWIIVLLIGCWFAIGIRQAAVHHTSPPTWPTLILSLYLVVLPLAFIFLTFSKLHILWLVAVIWQLSLIAGVGYIPVVSQLLIWPAYIYVCILMIGTGMSLTSPSRQSPWAQRLPKQWPWLKHKIRKPRQGSKTGRPEDSVAEDNANFLYEKLWRESLSDIVPEATAKDIATELLIPDRIDGFAFASNYATFLRRGAPSVEDLFGSNNNATPSISEAASPLNHIPSFPDWFIAAYPDVFLWFHKVQDERMRNRKADEDWDDAMETLICGLFEIHPEDKEFEESNIYDSDRKWLPKWLRNLVASYKGETGKNPEASVDETKNNAMCEIYDNVELAERMNEAGIDNFTLIARKTMMYYLELLNNYRQEFASERYLLAAAGVFDAQVYIFMNKSMEISEIVELAEKIVANEDEFLTEFIVGLEAKILAVDTPELTREMVADSCQEEKPRIHEEIQRVQREYKRDPFIAKEVQAFMESPHFNEMRQQLGIR